jgi:hypothetical protein
MSLREAVAKQHPHWHWVQVSSQILGLLRREVRLPCNDGKCAGRTLLRVLFWNGSIGAPEHRL